MQGQGGYQILDYREFTSENYEKIYNLITTNKMYLIEHFKTDEVEEISLFLTAIKNENDITFLYNNKTQTLVYTKQGITNNLEQGGGSESKYKLHIIKCNFVDNIDIEGSFISITDADIECLQNHNYFCVFEDNGYYAIPVMYNETSIDFIYNNSLIKCQILLESKEIQIKNNYKVISLMSIIDLGDISDTSGTIEDIYIQIDSAFKSNYMICMYASILNMDVYFCPLIISRTNMYLLYFYIEDSIIQVVIGSDNNFTTNTIKFAQEPNYNTLQVSGIESIPVNSSLTTSIQSLTDKNTTITSIKPSVAGVIVSAPYFDETDNCYKTTIFNATTSAVSDLTLTIDYYTLIQD